jgi:cell division protein FtsI/penicillin-binding protein 2
LKRFGGILSIFVLLGAAIVARLFQVQVVEHELWAGRAARLVRSGREEPYRRGRILDARGRVLARDSERRSVVLVYREFRRGHPLGQVVHARSLLAGRPVPLTDGSSRLVDWARELCLLRPADVAAFAAGEPVEGHPELATGVPRPGRAADLTFYLRRLLDLEPREWRSLEARGLEERDRTFLELAAEVRRGASERAEEEWLACEARLRESMRSLEVLARWLEPPAVSQADPLRQLVRELEEVRRGVEDATAAKLFAEATGFAPGRIEPGTLLDCFDHAWLLELLGWDQARLREWAQVVREGWLVRWRGEVALPRLLWALVLDPPPPGGRAPLDAFLDRLVALYRPEGALEEALGPEGPRPWRTVDELAVFSDLEELFEANPDEPVLRIGRTALPTQQEDLRRTGDGLGLLPPGADARARLEAALDRRRQRDVEVLLGLAGECLARWELRYQETLRHALDALRVAAADDERGLRGGLVLSASNRARAAERTDFYLMDYGQRTTPLASDLAYDVVYLLTRYERDFPGFQVSDDSVRESVELPSDDVRPAEGLLGGVSAQSLADVLRQREDMARYRELKASGRRDQREDEELERLIGALRLPDEVKGTSGIEGYFEPELAGTNGFVETRGLAELVESSGDEIVMREPVDGLDVRLTIDADLSAAVQRSLRHPAEGDEKEDSSWRRNPVGAVVLLSVDGDVLAACSEPDDQSVIDPDAQQQRLVRSERTLRKPTFQPPGSVFKVFLAAWALDHGLDPERTVTCGPLAGRSGSGFKDLRCWNSHGHGPVNLEQAIERSCNAYFAWLGETLRTDQFVELADQFGFGQPTGVRRAPPWAPLGEPRIGLFEDTAGLALGSGRWPENVRHMAGNGLAVVEATPMQLARATLALATGELRELRLVQRIGEREIPRAPPVPLGLSPASLRFVRRAMERVAAAPQGTAHGAMAPDVLGLDVALKTGSADLENRKDGQGHYVVTKHAWVAGWVPAHDPKLVVVVFEHRTQATSSHGAVYLARQVLWQPEVLAWLANEGVDVSRVAAR